MRATVTTPNRERFEGVTGVLLDYYKGEAEVTPGYQIVEDEADSAATFPQVWEDGERVDDGALVTVGEQGPELPLDRHTSQDDDPSTQDDPDGGDDEDHPRPSPNPAA